MWAVVRISYSLILIAALGLIVAQINFVSEVNAAKEIETECEIIYENPSYIGRTCCQYEVDTETGERTLLADSCWTETCEIHDGVEQNCGTLPLPTGDPSDLQLGEQQEVQPVPPPTPGNDLTNLAPGQGEILPTPSTAMTQDEGITPPPLFGRNDANVLGDGGFTQQPFTTSETLPSPTGPSIFPEDGILKQPSAQEPEEQSVEEENEQVIARDDSDDDDDDDDDGPVPPECPLTGPIPPDCTMKPKFPTEIAPD